jgi:hypothetical protein
MLTTPPGALLVITIVLPYLDDMMGVHLKVKEEMEKKRSENAASGDDNVTLTTDMIISSCMQVPILPKVTNIALQGEPLWLSGKVVKMRK